MSAGVPALLASITHTEWSRLDSLVVNHQGPAPLPNPGDETVQGTCELARKLVGAQLNYRF